MKTASAKAKGRTLQQWVRDKLLHYSNGALTKDDVRSTSMGAQGEDLQLSHAARVYYQMQIECKSRARIAVYEWYEQAGAHGPYEPVVFIKANRKKPLAIVDAEYLIKLLS